MGMIDVKIIKKAKQSGGVLTPGTGSGGGYAGGTPSGEAAEAGHALRADFADLADRANRAAEADRAKEADHAASARDLDSDSPANDRFIRKDQEDRTPYQLASDMGFDVGQFLASVSGGRFGIDKVTGQSFLEVDRIFARVRAYFESLTVVERESLAGEQMVTPGGGVTCTSVEEVRNGQNVLTGWRCYFLSEQDGEKRETKIKAGDQAIAQTFNAKAGTTNKVSNHRWWRLVTGVSNNAYTDDNGNVYGYIEVSASDCETDSDTPKEGDDVIQFGNRTDKTRQAAILISTVASDAPSIKLLTGIDHYSLVGKDIISQGYDAAKGHAYFRCYGDTYIGAPDGSTYVKFDLDANKTTVKADLEIGSTIGGKGVSDFVKDLIPEQEIKQEDIEDYVNNIVDPKIEGIQNQIDGVIETWFYNGVPTLTNYPASEWNTESLKTQHLGDLYYDNDTGTAYRFSQKADKSYYWNVITDDAITKALAAAQKAQDTADGKRRTFTSQPTPPYDKGDIWVNATYPAGNTVKDAANGKYVNDILRCNTSRATGSFAIGDWGLASNYTDDTAALAAAQAAKAAKDAADAAQSAANAAQSSVTSLNNYVDGAFKDGIIDETEASGIANYINIVNADKERIDGTYQTLYANAYLSATGKAALKTAHDDVAAKITALINAINNAIADNKVTAAESAAVDSAFSAFSTSNKAFSSAVETANAEIQKTLKSAADAAKTAADNAKATADNAQSVADAAKDRLDSWAADGVISPTEKQAIKDEIARIKGEKADIAAQYTKYGGTTPQAYLDAYTAYYNQLVALSASTPENITIPATFATNQTQYYTQRTVCVKAIADLASAYADKVAKEEATKATDPFKYLKENLLNAQKESTEISGGLIIATMMGLGYTENGVRKLLAGMNGSYNTELGGRTIASWYGGNMLDLFDKNDNRIANPTGQEATSLIRMDGSAYFLNGDIQFRSDRTAIFGSGATAITISNGSVKLGNGILIDIGGEAKGLGDSIASVTTLVNALSNVLVPVNASGARVAWDSADLWAVKSVKGFYSEEFVSARGMNGQSSSISKYLTDLLDTAISAPVSGQALVYNGSKWVNQAIQTGLDTTQLANYLTTNNYAKKSDIPSLANYVTLDTAQTITGKKSFGDGIWAIAPNEQNEITSQRWATKTWGNQTARLYAITQSLRFNWYDSAWFIGNIRSDSVQSIGFGIGYLSDNKSYIEPAFRVGTSGVYYKEQTILHAGNTYLSSGTITINGTSITPLTSHQSLANYYTKSEVDTKDKRLTTYYASRPASANVNFSNNAGLYTFLATSSMTTGKPGADAHILHMEWDNSLSWAGQIAVPSNTTPGMQWRFQNGTTWQSWRTLLDTSNFNTLIGSNLTAYVKKAGDTMTGVLGITMNNATLQLGAQNTTWMHIYSSLPIAFNNNLTNAGKTDSTLGTSANRWANLYATTINVSSTSLVSNLNADLLDGLHATSFAYYKGALTSATTAIAGVGFYGWSTSTGGFGSTYGDSLVFQGHSTWYNRLDFNTNGNIDFWHAINPSSLSGSMSKVGTLAFLHSTVANANSLGGKAASQYVTTDTAQTISGVKTFSNGLISDYDNDFISHNNEFNYVPSGFSGSLHINYRTRGGTNGAITEYDFRTGNASGYASIKAASFIRNGGTASQFLKADGSVDGNSYLTTGSASSTYVKKAGDTMSGKLYLNTTNAHVFADSTYGAWLQYGSNYINIKDNGIWYNNTHKLWHAGNDGSGSGLDADLLDGVHNGSVTANRLNFYSRYDSSTSDTSNLAIIKQHYTEFPVEQPCALGLRHGSLSMAFGWRLGGTYNSIDKAYCGWFISDYGTPRWIGADNGTWKSETFAFLSSNVASATQLATARTLWGQSFNGTGNVSGNMTGVGTIYCQGTSSSYCEGIRIKPYSSWSTIVLGGNDLTADSGTSTNTWGIFNNNGTFYINKGTSNTAQVARAMATSTGWTFGNTSTNTYALNCASFICDSWVRSKGATGWYNESYGGGWYMTDTTWLRTYNRHNIYASTGTIRTDGQFQVGSDGSKFYANSSGVVFASAGIWSNGYVSARGQNTSSDERLKNILRPLSLNVRDIANAPSVEFIWRKDGVKDVGSIAQYWRKLIPQLAPDMPDGSMGLQYGKTALMSVIAVAKKTISLEERVAQLERENSELKSQISQLKTQLA